MNRTVVIGAVLTVLGLLAIGGGVWHLHTRKIEYESRVARAQEDEKQALARQLLAWRVETGKAYLTARQWDAALKALREARASEQASNGEEVDALIVQAEQGQAAALLESARSTLRRRDAAGGVRLLRAYLAHARASEKTQAEQLVAQVRSATARDQAVALLRQSSDAQLDRLDAGDIPAGDRVNVTDALVRPIFLDTLRAALPAERQRRAALLAAARADAERLARERAAREKRVHESAPYKEIAELARDLRKRYLAEREMLDRQKRALERLARELNLAGEELARLRKNLDEAEKKAAALPQTFVARRDAARKAFGALAGVTAADLEVFDQLVGRLAEGLAAGKS
jgi:hypothetical protein